LRTYSNPVVPVILAIMTANAGSIDSRLSRPDGVLAVLSTSGVPAYRAAIEGLEAALRRQGEDPPAIFEMASERDRATVDRLRAARPRLVVSVGSRACAVAAGLDIRYVSTMLLQEEAAPPPRAQKAVALVTLDVPPGVVFLGVRRVFPAVHRIAVIRDRSQTEPSVEAIRTQATAAGLALKLIECSSPKEALEVLPRLRGKVDLIWCLPNRELYEPASVQAMILASIRYHLPLIGFSEAFVKAGALVGSLPDYRRIGGQTADLLDRYEEGRPVGPVEHPRYIRTIVNQRVVRALGIALSGDRKGMGFVQ
jgi:ABC-type uncharacterized transport system substrate-binding protein